MGQIIRTRLLFAHDNFVSPALVVASQGAVGDWAAYVAGVTLSQSEDHEPESAIARVVAANGYKLTEDQARAFFPDVKLEYRP